VADKDGFDPSDCIDYIGEMVCELILYDTRIFRA